VTEQVRTKPTIHVTMTRETLAMVDEMAAEDAPPGARPDRSRLIGQLVGREWERRAQAILAASKPIRGRK
jgi:hypothetical protein